MAYFESGGLEEPGLKVLIYGDSIAGGWTRPSPNPTPDCPWDSFFHRELHGIVRKTDMLGIMGATTQGLVDILDKERGLRTHLKDASNILGKSYDFVIISVGTADHMKLSGSSSATPAWREDFIRRLSALAEVVQAAGARCVYLSILEHPSRWARRTLAFFVADESPNGIVSALAQVR